jgi:hypothetical protein
VTTGKPSALVIFYEVTTEITNAEGLPVVTEKTTRIMR